MVVAEAPMETEAGSNGFTSIVTVLLVAGFPVAQGVALEVITTETTSLSFNAEVVNVLLLAPAFVPFTFHWYVGLVPPLVGVAVKVTDVP